jgi:hypothetical protein
VIGSRRWASTMSEIVTIGNESAQGLPMAGLIELGPVLPEHPPSTFEHTMK